MQAAGKSDRVRYILTGPGLKRDIFGPHHPRLGEPAELPRRR
jgi:hypothetical protein